MSRKSKTPRYLTASLNPDNRASIHSLNTRHLPVTATATAKGKLFDMVQGFVGDNARLTSTRRYEDPDDAALRLSIQPDLRLSYMKSKVLSDNLRRDKMTDQEQEDLHTRKLQLRNALEHRMRRKLAALEQVATDQYITDGSMRAYDQGLTRNLGLHPRFTPLRNSVLRNATKEEIDRDIAKSIAEDASFISHLSTEEYNDTVPRFRNRGGKKKTRRHKRSKFRM